MFENFLIKGSGNIALRHAINIKKNSKKNKILFLTNNNTSEFKNFCKKNKFFVYNNEEKLDNIKIKAILICSPSKFHIKNLKTLSNLSNNFFIEKPISSKLSEALKVLEYKKKLIFVGYNLLYDKKLIYLKKLIKKKIKKFGKLYYVQCDVGQCLKTWRRNKDYTKTVSAKKSLGGGVLLELSHEINYLCWLFGRPKKISSNIKKVSKLKIDVEDYAVHNINFKKNLICNLRTDFIRKDKKRNINLVFENYSIFIDFVKDKIKIINNIKAKIISFKINSNTSYKDQLNFFLDLIKRKKKDPNLRLALDTLNVIKYARLSNKNNSKTIQIKYDY